MSPSLSTFACVVELVKHEHQTHETDALLLVFVIWSVYLVKLEQEQYWFTSYLLCPLISQTRPSIYGCAANEIRSRPVFDRRWGLQLRSSGRPIWPHLHRGLPDRQGTGGYHQSSSTGHFKYRYYGLKVWESGIKCEINCRHFFLSIVNWNKMNYY